MLDLTGGSLVSYLLRILEDVANRNPRFRNSLGKVTFQNSNQINFTDVQVIVQNVSSSGTRLSPDYFMFTQHGRVINAQVADKQGSFIEYTRETSEAKDSGVYYINVDAVNEQTREIDFTIHKFKWREGIIKGALGSKILFRDGILPSAMSYFKEGNAQLVVDTDFTAPPGVNFVLLQTPVQTLVVKNGSTVLTPLTDYWYERALDSLLGTTLGGFQDFVIPTGYSSISITDQDDFELRPGYEYEFAGPDRIRLGRWTPAGSILTAHVIQKTDPSSNNPIHPENFLDIALASGESLAPGQVFIQTTAGDVTNVTQHADGTMSLPALLNPGDYARYEVRIDCGQFKSVAKKMELNQLLDADGSSIIPGVWLAIGDSVVVGDQAALIVAPERTETYQVFGSKDNINFTLEFKANDLITASELSEAVKNELTITRRDSMESDGITVLEVSREQRGGQRDPSGVNVTYSYLLGVTALADWKVYKPLVTRLVSTELDYTNEVPDFPHKLQLAAKLQALGTTSFAKMQDYS